MPLNITKLLETSYIILFFRNASYDKDPWDLSKLYKGVFPFQARYRTTLGLLACSGVTLRLPLRRGILLRSTSLDESLTPQNTFWVGLGSILMNILLCWCNASATQPLHVARLHERILTKRCCQLWRVLCSWTGTAPQKSWSSRTDWLEAGVSSEPRYLSYSFTLPVGFSDVFERNTSTWPWTKMAESLPWSSDGSNQIIDLDISWHLLTL